MNVERATSATSLIDVLDRVLDKGIAIDAWVRVSLAGIDLLTVEARMVAASLETWFKYADTFAAWEPMTRIVKQVSAGGVQVQLSDRLPVAGLGFEKSSRRS